MERTEKNGGICPDNVDADGVIGGGRERADEPDAGCIRAGYH